jgi:hypothetical protein
VIHPDLYLKAYVDQALVELTQKSLRQIQFDTAKTWYGRAIAAVKLGRPADAIEYAHESIEHAALSGDDGFLRNLREALKNNGIAL